jgi:hypothetical protein
LFNVNEPLSVEVEALYLARDVLSQSTALQELLEVGRDAAGAARLIVVGPHDPPFNGESYTVSELQNRFCYAQMLPQLEEESMTALRAGGVGALSEPEGSFQLQIRRQVRKRELYNTTNGRRDVYLYFLDRVSRMCEEVVEIDHIGMTFKSIRRRRGPLFNPDADQEAQGMFVWADFTITWKW